MSLTDWRCFIHVRRAKEGGTEFWKWKVLTDCTRLVIYEGIWCVISGGQEGNEGLVEEGDSI